LVAVSIINFLIMHAVPGGPFDEDKQPLPPAAKANILRKYGLDKPLYVQYLSYVGNALHGDFGISYQQPSSTVIKLISDRWGVTRQVGLITILLAFGLGLPLGIIAAYYQNSWLDNLVTFLAMIGVTLPNFVWAFLLLFIFAIRLDWLPMRGWGDSTCLVSTYFCSDWILPVVSYALVPMSVIARYTRSSVVDVIRSDFVRTARAKGLNERSIMLGHVLRNALIPMVTVLAPIIPDLITGSIFIESVYAINGLGMYFVTSSRNRDYPMVMALALLISMLWGLVYLLTDLAYGLIDPRVRLGGEGGR
jgi:ABC-type dipeptide/oligopeptide/nickel transport system permease component